MRVALHIARQSQGFQNPKRGGAGQSDRSGERRDGGAFQAIEHRQHLESAIQGANGTGGFPAARGRAVDGIREGVDLRVHGASFLCTRFAVDQDMYSYILYKGCA